MAGLARKALAAKVRAGQAAGGPAFPQPIPSASTSNASPTTSTSQSSSSPPQSNTSIHELQDLKTVLNLPEIVALQKDCDGRTKQDLVRLTPYHFILGIAHLTSNNNRMTLEGGGNGLF